MTAAARATRAARALLALVGAALTTGCSATALVNVLSPSGHYSQEAGLAYGEEPRQRLDVYRPLDATADAPVVVFFYGNGWRAAERADFEFVAAGLTAAGIIVVIPDYRAYPEVAFPAFVEDGAAAVAWTAANIAGVADGRRELFLMGHSAGAQIAALLAMDPRYLDRLAQPPPVAGFIGLAGPYDFLPLDPGYMEEVFPEETRELSQPIEFVSAQAPPTLLVHGTGDRRVLPAHSRRLADSLAAHDVPVTLKMYDNSGHVRVVAAMAPPLRFIDATLADCIAFIDEISARGRDN